MSGDNQFSAECQI